MKYITIYNRPGEFFAKPNLFYRVTSKLNLNHINATIVEQWKITRSYAHYLSHDGNNTLEKFKLNEDINSFAKKRVHFHSI